MKGKPLSEGAAWTGSLAETATQCSIRNSRVWATELALPWGEDWVLYEGVPDLSEARRQLVCRFVSQRLGLSETNVRFSVSGAGQPLLESVPGITVNWSHRLSFLLIAIAKGRMGVDLEIVDVKIPYMDIAVMFFSNTVVRTLRTLHPQVQPMAFFLLWTICEAYVKALGQGLDESLTRTLDLAPVLRNRAALKADITQTIYGPGLARACLFSGLVHCGGQRLRLTKITAR